MNAKKTIFINGNSFFFDDSISIFNLLKYLGYDSNLIIVEYNNKIYDSKLWKKTNIKQGDKLEFITIVGGG